MDESWQALVYAVIPCAGFHPWGWMRKHFVSLCLLLLVFGVTSPRAQQAQAPFHVLRIAAGPAGVEEKGTFRLTEERSVFSRSDDREVIVYFQWEGTPGRHQLEATWRNPDGSGTTKSVIDYTANERRFGAYWRFALTPSTTLGMWSIEATVDGQPGGRFTFEVTDKPAPPAPVVKQPLTQQALHERLARHFIVLSRKVTGVRELEPAAASLVVSGQVVTAVKLLDSVDGVAAVMPGGATVDLPTIVALDRAAGWAILEAPGTEAPTLPLAASPRIGDRCFSMQGTDSGGRVLLEGQISGTVSGQASGWIASFFNGAAVAGAPVVNEYGELLGIAGRPPRADVPIGLRALAASSVELGNVPVIPIDTIRPGAAMTPGTFASFRARGELLEPLVMEEHIVSGGFASETPRGTIPRPEIQREEFSKTDKEMVVFVTWGPRSRIRGQATFHLFDPANRRVMSSKPAKVDVRPKDLATSVWRNPVPQAPGIYRAELHLDGKPVWRSYVRIIP